MKLTHLSAVSACCLGLFIAAGCGDESKATKQDETNIKNLSSQGIAPPPAPGTAPGAQPTAGTPVSGVVDDP